MTILFSLVEKHIKDHGHFDKKDEIFQILSRNPHLFHSTKDIKVEYDKENFGSIETTKKFNIQSYSRYLNKVDLSKMLYNFRKRPLRRNRSLSQDKIRQRSRSRDLKVTSM